MSNYPNPPNSWVHIWLSPLYSWLTGLTAALNGKLGGQGAPQLLTGAGAANVTALVTLFTSTAASQAVSLADGTAVGQLKFVHHSVAGGSGVLTPAHPGNFATFTLSAVHDSCLLHWSGTAWNLISNTGGTVA